MPFNKRKTIIAVVLIIIGAASFLFLRFYVFNKVVASIEDRLQSLKVSGFNVSYDSISVNWPQNVIVVENLVLEKNAYDTTCIYPEFISVSRIRAEGFRLFPLIFKNKLSFESMHLETPHIVMRDDSQLIVDSATQRVNEFTLSIDHVVLKSAHFEYTDTLNCELINSLKTDLAIDGLEMDFHVKTPFIFAMEFARLDSSELKVPKEFYTFQMHQARIDFSKRTIQADTVRVIPDLGKIEFGKKTGYEIDRFEATIPFIKLSGFSYGLGDSTFISSKLADIQFYLKVFRDKRLPFKAQAKELPVAQLKKLPFALDIDSLKVTKSYVLYEELVKSSADAGVVFFDDLSASFVNVNNRANTGTMTMAAKASLMGQGAVSVSAIFPLRKNRRARLTGAIENFNIPRINSMLTPSTNIKVETGNMNRLSFNFSFNNVRSDGSIELNYNDLKLVSFKDEQKDGKANKSDGNDLQKDNLKTFIMNTFIFRKNMDEKVPEEKRTGTVMFVRDNSRSVFNFWVKSLLSGLKSAYNLDKPAAQKKKREEKKEERLTKRQERKLRKAEKKKERG